MPPFHLFLEIPPPPGKDEESPALLPVAGNPVAVRLAAGAARSGAAAITVTGRASDLDAIRPLFERDPRLAGLALRFAAEADKAGNSESRGELEASDLPRIRTRADAAVSTNVWRDLAAAREPVFVPGVSLLEREGEGDPRPLWDPAAAPPAHTFAVPVHDRREAQAAVRTVFAHISKPTSGPISRHLNSKLSIPISKLLVRTPMTPNQMTLVNTAIGLAGAAFAAFGTATSLALSGLILQLTSALDRCDGELARARLLESERGAWLDSIGDNVVYVAYAVCFTGGWLRASEAGAAWLRPVATGALGLALLVIAGMLGYLYAHRHRLGGSLSVLSRAFREKRPRGLAGRLFRALDRIEVLGQRDQFSLGFFGLSLLPLLGGALLYDVVFFTFVGFLLLAALYFSLGVLSASAPASE